MVEPNLSDQRRLRVLVTFPWSVTAGGGQYTAITSANVLARRGHAVTYCSENGPALDLLDPAVQFRRVPASLALVCKRLFPFWPSSIFRFLQAVLRTKPDLIHAYCAPSFLLGCMARVVSGTPCLYSELGPMLPPREVCELAGRMIVCSPELREKLAVHYGLDREQIIVIPNHIDLEVYRPGLDGSGLLKRLGLEPVARRIVVLGRVTPSKYGTIASVFAAVPKILEAVPALEVVIVGTGESFEQAEREAQALNQKAGRVVVRLTGALIDVPQVLNLAEIVVGIGRSALEGMACQKPTLIVGQMGYAGTVCAEMAGELSHFNFAGRNLKQPSAPHRLPEEAIRLLTDREYATTVAQFARAYVEEHVNASRDAQTLEQIYSDLLRHQALHQRTRAQLALALAKRFISHVFVPRRLAARISGAAHPRPQARLAERSHL